MCYTFVLAGMDTVHLYHLVVYIKTETNKNLHSISFTWTITKSNNPIL